MEIFEDQDQFESLEQELINDTPAPASQEEDIPDKYRGKSAADIVRMHQEAEKVISRQGQEVAEVRRLADQLIQQSFQNQAPRKEVQPEPEDTLDDVDFFADPKQAVAKAVSQHPAVLQAQAAAVRLARQESVGRLEKKHPDFKEVIADEGFRTWVNGSTVRQQLFASADRNYNFEAGDELLSTYKELKGLSQQRSTNAEVEEIQKVQERSLRAASNPAVGTSSEPAGRKIYSRAELIRMQLYKPDLYDDLQPEIMAAYAEGRVKN